jgi:hypothetical protein
MFNSLERREHESIVDHVQRLLGDPLVQGSTDAELARVAGITAKRAREIRQDLEGQTFARLVAEHLVRPEADARTASAPARGPRSRRDSVSPVRRTTRVKARREAPATKLSAVRDRMTNRVGLPGLGIREGLRPVHTSREPPWSYWHPARPGVFRSESKAPSTRAVRTWEPGEMGSIADGLAGG